MQLFRRKPWVDPGAFPLNDNAWVVLARINRLHAARPDGTCTCDPGLKPVHTCPTFIVLSALSDDSRRRLGGRA